MNNTIWKFPLRVTGEQSVAMPVGAEILSVQAQDNEPCIWALVDATGKLKNRTFSIFGTGDNVPADNLKFVGTFQVVGGSGIFHLFEQLPYTIRQ